MEEKVINSKILDKMVDLYIKKSIEFSKVSKKLNQLSIKAFSVRKMTKEFVRTNECLEKIMSILSHCMAYFESYHNTKQTLNAIA